MTIPWANQTSPLPRDQELGEYRPFPSSPEIRAHPFETSRTWDRNRFPFPEDTGLPQTEPEPGTDADGLTARPSGSMRVLEEDRAEYEGVPSVLGTFQLKRERITQCAEAAAAHWQASTSSPTAQPVVQMDDPSPDWGGGCVSADTPLSPLPCPGPGRTAQGPRIMANRILLVTGKG